MNETVKETVKDVVSSIKDLSGMLAEPAKKRMAHPFIGSFAISWILFNWKPISYFIMTSSKIEDRIKYIDSNFYHWNTLFAFPLLAAVFYTLILNWFDTFSDEINKIPNARRSKSIADNTIEIIKNDIRIITEQKKLENAKAENKELEELNNKIELLSKELDIKDERISAMQQDLMQRLRQLESLEKQNKDINSKLISSSTEIEKIISEHKIAKMNILNVMKNTTPANQFSETMKIVREINPDLLTDKEFDELFPSINSLENDYESEYYLSLSSSKELDKRVTLLKSFDDRITVRPIYINEEKGRSNVKLTVTYPDRKMKEEIDLIIAGQ